MTPDQILATLAALVAGQTNPDFDQLRSGGYDARYPVTVEACDYPPAPFEVEGQTIICGIVSVPEHHDRPDGRRIDLKFAIFDALTNSPASDPLVYLHGGPAFGTLHIIDPVATKLFPRHRMTRDVITFDQRGAALSSGSVQCYENLSDHILDLALADKGKGDPAIFSQIIEPCVAEIRAMDVDLTAYNTENNARDVRALMSALGYGDYNIYGISYGTRLALEVMRTAPEGVRSVTIDGVAPAFVPILSTYTVPLADGLDMLVAQCEADVDCAAAYPDLTDTINAAFERADRDPIPGGRGVPAVDSNMLYDLTFERRNNWREQAVITPYLPRIFSETVRGETAALDALLAGLEAQPDPMAQIGAATLSEDETALARAALDMAGAMAQLSGSADATIARLRQTLGTTTKKLNVADAFDQRASEALAGMTDRASVAAFVSDYAALRAGAHDRAALTTFVETHFTGPDHTDLSALIAMMGPDDIARTFRIAAESTRPYEIAVERAIGLDLYICQESVPFNSIEKYDEVNAPLAAKYPLFGDDFFRNTIQYQLAQCDAFEQTTREAFFDPVRSDIPTLVLNGTLDVQTSMHWGARAAESLTNARNYIIPEAGHGTISYQPCAKDIAVAFVNDPGAELDVSCIDGLSPRFILPDDPLP